MSATESPYFLQQRALLVNDVAASLESVLQNLNKLNRSLEGVIAVGNEFSQVEGLWSQFENVMAKDDSASSSNTTGSGNKEDSGRKDTREGAASGAAAGEQR